MRIFTCLMALKRRRHRPRYPDLATYIQRTGDTQRRIAEQIGVSQAYISRVKDGKLVPSPELAERLAAYAHIPLDSFYRVYLLKRGAA